jgi:hypothetical protein
MTILRGGWGAVKVRQIGPFVVTTQVARDEGRSVFVNDDCCPKTLARIWNKVRMRNMSGARDKLVDDLEKVVATARDRVAALQTIAEILKRSGDYRWV